MTVVAALIGAPTILLLALDWGRAVDLPSSIHHLLVVAAAQLALGAGVLWIVGLVADWLDARHAIRVAELQRREDQRLDAVIDALVGRFMGIEQRAYDRGYLHGTTGQRPETTETSTREASTRALWSVPS